MLVWKVKLTDELKEELETFMLDNFQHIVSPNKIHHIFLKEWQDAFPKAKVYAPPGLKERAVAKGIRFDHELEEFDDENSVKNCSYLNDISQVIVKGSYFMEEVVFYHKKSKTALVADLIQRFPEEELEGWKCALMKMDGLVGKEGSTPREWRFSFLVGKEQARLARDCIVNDWKPENLIIAHGECVKDGTATEVISKALGWLDKFHDLF
jgi:hypothetical protein